MAKAAPTFLAYLHDNKLHEYTATVTRIQPFSSIEEANKLLHKQGTDDDFVVVTDKTIFHPQGGGQPTDEGTITSPSSGRVFNVTNVRMDAVNDWQVLHFGRFAPTATDDTSIPFTVGEEVRQAIDVDKRLLYSRYHTAGHVLDAAVRNVVEDKIGFDKLKASHFPDSAGCEFHGSIEGKWKDAIQQKFSEFISAGLPVAVDWWDEDDFRANGCERWIPDRSLAPPGDKFRVIKVADIDMSPCGGTHVDTTDLCGEGKVRKITRNKGTSRVAYAIS